MSKQARLDQIAAEIVKNNVCPDLAKQAKHLVFGEGSPNAAIIFIGEAPGRKEDESGRPFVGPSGKFLEQLLESIGLRREDVYITSILKYRPPNNRDPKPEEKTAFWPYLEAQIEAIAPKLIVTLGRHSANCFLPDLQIGKAHGKPQQWKSGAGSLDRNDPPRTWTILPLYHPAAAIYNQGLKQTLISDFAQIPKLIRL